MSLNEFPPEAAYPMYNLATLSKVSYGVFRFQREVGYEYKGWESLANNAEE